MVTTMAPPGLTARAMRPSVPLSSMLQHFGAPGHVVGFHTPVAVEVDVEETVRDRDIAVARFQPRRAHVDSGVLRHAVLTARQVAQKDAAAAADIERVRPFETERGEGGKGVFGTLVDRTLAGDAEVGEAQLAAQGFVDALRQSHRGSV